MNGIGRGVPHPVPVHPPPGFDRRGGYLIRPCTSYMAPEILFFFHPTKKHSVREMPSAVQDAGAGTFIFFSPV